MSKQEKKMAGAMRIFEALSGVDEDLVVRCEATVSSRPFWYYGKVMAACLCFVVMGVLLWSVGPAFKNSKESAESAEMALVASGETPAAAPDMQDGTSMQNTPMEEIMEEGVAESIAENSSGSSAYSQSGDTGAGESVKQENAIENQNAEIQDLQGSKSGTQDSVTTESCPLDKRKEMTLKEAKTVAVLGAYVPETIPADYIFESARVMENGSGEAELISLSWMKGMDDIHITISLASPDIAVVDINKPETYNVHQYEIPYATSVPDEYRKIFNHPVFAEKDFSLKIVEARMKVVADAGDTDTPRGNFAVLYDNGILIEFNGNGDAESIYAMLK